MYAERTVADGFRDLIGIQSRRIDNKPRTDLSFVGGSQEKRVVRPLDGLYFERTEQRCTVIHGVSDRRNGEFIRANDAACGSIERAGCMLADIGLQSTKFFGIDQADPLHTVGDPAGNQFPQLDLILIAKTDHQ